MTPIQDQPSWHLLLELHVDHYGALVDRGTGFKLASNPSHKMLFSLSNTLAHFAAISSRRSTSRQIGLDKVIDLEMEGNQTERQVWGLGQNLTGCGRHQHSGKDPYQK